MLILMLLSCGDMQEIPINQRGLWTEVPPPPNAPPNYQCFVWSRNDAKTNTNYGGPWCGPRKVEPECPPAVQPPARRE